MTKAFLKKLVNREYGELTYEELKLIINNETVFSLSKKDTKALVKIIDNNALDSSKDKITNILRDGLPNIFMILSRLDKQSVVEGAINIDFRKRLIENLNKMNNLRLCYFIDKVLKTSKDERIRFFWNQEYSLHAINEVISKSLGLTLVFEIFKPGKYQTFKDINYHQIDKKQMIDVINSQSARYIYILEGIAEVVLETNEEELSGTKINKRIKQQISDYLNVVLKEKEAVRATGVKAKKTWIYNLGNNISIHVEDDDEFFYEEIDDE